MSDTNKNVYELLTKKSAAFYQKVVGKKKYTIHSGNINIDDIHLSPVDGIIKTGNPRFFNVHRLMLTKKPDCGPMTESQQMEYFHSGTVAGFDMDPDQVVKEEFAMLVAGLKANGEPYDEIVLTHYGSPVDGNRSTCAAKLLKEQGDDRFNTLRCDVLPSGVKESDLRIVLAIRNGGGGKAEWESIDKVTILMDMRDKDGLSPEQIAESISLSPRKVKLLLLSGDKFVEYQNATKDMTPENFTVFYKVASSAKLKNVLYDDAGKDGKAHEDYDPDFKKNFFGYIKNKKINDCRDIAHLTSKDVGLLKSPEALRILEKDGTTAAINYMRLKVSNKINQPGLKKLEEAIKEIDVMKISQAEILSKDVKYLSKLRALAANLNEMIDRRFDSPKQAVDAVVTDS